MKILLAALIIGASTCVAAADKGVRFHVQLKRDGKVIESSSASGALGQPLKVSMKNGMFVDAIAEPPAPDGRSRTQIRINLYHNADTDMTQEFSTRAKLDEGLSFDYDVGNSGFKLSVEVAETTPDK